METFLFPLARPLLREGIYLLVRCANVREMKTKLCAVSKASSHLRGQLNKQSISEIKQTKL